MNQVLLLTCFCWLSASNLSAQLYLKIEPLPDADSWGVFMKPCDDLTPSNNTITGSGQVTVHFQSGLVLSGFTSHAGTWMVNAEVAGPAEAPDKHYTSVGFVFDNPKITYHPALEVLLFSFKLQGNGPKTPELLENGSDPFDQLPNSMNTNPGNEISVIDFGVSPTGFYNYTGNYVSEDIPCETTVPQDSTIVIPQDSTGTGGDSTVVVIPQDSTGTITGLFDQKPKKQAFTFSPNPAYEWVSVVFSSPDERNGLIRLWGSNGTPFGKLERGLHDTLKLNLNGLSTGLYFLTYEVNGKLVQREPLIKH